MMASEDENAPMNLTNIAWLGLMMRTELFSNILNPTTKQILY